MAVYNIKAEKDTRCTQSVLQIKGDRHTQILRFHVDRYDGGVDLSEYTWAIQTRNAAGVEDAFSPEAVEIFENVILVDWMLKGSVTAKDGLTEYELSALEYMDDETTPVWRGGIGTISVRNNLSPSFGNVEGLTEVEQLILYVDGKLHEVISAGEEASSAAVRANAAADRAEPAADSAETAANMANDAASAAITAAANAKSAASIADASAASANEAILNLADYTSEYALRVRGEIGESAGNPVTIAPDEGSLMRPVTVFGPKQTGSGDPSPSNVRPISGWDVLGLTHVGKNLFGGEALKDAFLKKVPNCQHDADARTIRYNAQHVSDVIIFDKFKPNTRYTIILNGLNTTSYKTANLYVSYADGTSDALVFASETEYTNAVIVTKEGKTVKAIKGGWVTDWTTLKYDLCGVFEGVLTVDDFEPYNGDAYTAQPIQTVYAGRMDWNTGKLTDDYMLVTLDGSEATWTRYGSINGFTVQIPEMKDSTYAKGWASYIPVGSSFGKYEMVIGSNSNFLYFCHVDDVWGVSTDEELKAYLAAHPLQIVVPRATPAEYQLTPHQILALKGNNTLYGDGDTIETMWVKPLETSIKERTEPLIERIAALEAVILNS